MGSYTPGYKCSVMNAEYGLLNKANSLVYMAAVAILADAIVASLHLWVQCSSAHRLRVGRQEVHLFE